MNPCKNNSTCIDLYKSYRCECTSGWTGQNCSEEINECDSDPCMNGGLCHESTIPGQFVCLCPPLYTGRFCHQRYNPCDLLHNPCRNNSTCLALVDGNQHCICREEFEGKNCEIDVKECLFLSCQDYGDCEDMVNNFRCICRPGFSGSLCEIEINECSSEPCKNNGTCVDLTNRQQERENSCGPSGSPDLGAPQLGLQQHLWDSAGPGVSNFQVPLHSLVPAMEAACSTSGPVTITQGADTSAGAWSFQPCHSQCAWLCAVWPDPTHAC
ncbi:protein eyes shut homolog [Pongo pygmaeus]|uniref:protein eyes shut homolog n=1 Tax=Pongo pygmaeus TaxID=9600 RepID=UPI00300D4E49